MYAMYRCTRYRELGVVFSGHEYIYTIIPVGGTYRTGSPAPTYCINIYIITIISLVYHESYTAGGFNKCAIILVFSRPSHCRSSTLRDREDMWCCTVCTYGRHYHVIRVHVQRDI